MKFLFAKEVETTKGGCTRCEVVESEREIGDFASEYMFLKIKNFLTEETDEKRHVFSNDAPTFGERVFVEVLYDESRDEITDSEWAKVGTGLHEDTGLIVEKIDDDKFQYVYPNDIASYLWDVIFPDGLTRCPALDICCKGDDEVVDVESEFFTHGKDGEIIEVNTVYDLLYYNFLYHAVDIIEKVTKAMKDDKQNVVIFLDEEKKEEKNRRVNTYE